MSPKNNTQPTLVESVLNGNKRAIGRLMTEVESGGPDAEKNLTALFHHIGKAYRIGITGPPGAGKSTLTACLTKAYRQQNLRVGIVAVDPSSPFSGGAVLGDRIRMLDFSGDPGVYVRSMASRGNIGGLAEKAQEVADILDAAGFDIIIFETVGVGQTELSIAEAADTTIVVLVPESGDAIQAMKAGLMEIADVFVINKSDRDGADRLQREIDISLKLRTVMEWEPPILQTIASLNKGVDKLETSVESHRQAALDSGELGLKRSRRVADRLRQKIDMRLAGDFWTEARREYFEENVSAVSRRELSPERFIEHLFGLAE